VDWLHRRLGITQSGTVRLLDRLQQSDLITRDHRAGQREVEITLTDAGRRALASGLDARAEALQALLAPLSDSDQRQLIKLISKALAAGTRSRDAADVACRLCDWPGCGPGCPVDRSVATRPESSGD
jgi:DNA-binding MarR family transcriptional regulator